MGSARYTDLKSFMSLGEEPYYVVRTAGGRCEVLRVFVGLKWLLHIVRDHRGDALHGGRASTRIAVEPRTSL